jgi:hypothetical protein
MYRQTYNFIYIDLNQLFLMFNSLNVNRSWQCVHIYDVIKSIVHNLHRKWTVLAPIIPVLGLASYVKLDVPIFIWNLRAHRKMPLSVLVMKYIISIATYHPMFLLNLSQLDPIIISLPKTII